MAKATRKKNADPDAEARAALRQSLESYPTRPVEVYVWTLGDRRFATGTPPIDPKAKILFHERLD